MIEISYALCFSLCALANWRVAHLERDHSKRNLVKSIQSDFFLMKWSLGGRASEIYLLWFHYAGEGERSLAPDCAPAGKSGAEAANTTLRKSCFQRVSG
jgi:hypothetical protein